MAVADPLQLVHPVGLHVSPSARRWASTWRGPGLCTVVVSDAAGSPRVSASKVRVGGWIDDHRLLVQSHGRWGSWDTRAALSFTPDTRLGQAGALLGVHRGRYWGHREGRVSVLGIDSGTASSFEFTEPLLGGLYADAMRDVAAVRTVRSADTSALYLLDANSGVASRWWEPGWCIEGVAFLGDGRVVVTRMTAGSQCRQVLLLDGALEPVAVLHEETSDRGFARFPPAAAAGARVAHVAYVDGWPHVIVHDLDDGSAWVPLPGMHEDLTDVSDGPSFSPSGHRLAFNTSRYHPRQRHLVVADLRSREVERKSFEDAATGSRHWLDEDTLLYVQATVTEPADVRLLRLASPQRLPVVLAPERAAFDAVPPLHCSVPSDGLVVPCDLYLPKGFDAGRSYPAVVFAHGGVFRHMTAGFSTSYTYALLHTVNQFLLAEGYIVLSVDYRGSTGYGLDFEQANFGRAGIVDVDDCAAGARWLGQQPFVDERRIGIWGLSWGGTMVLGALARHPGLFAAGINIAGIWDFEQRARFWNALQVGQPIYFDGRMPGEGQAVDGQPAREAASPRQHALGKMAPLLSFHGTADVAVDYGQQALLASDAQIQGWDLTAVTFPDEGHVFESPAAWRETTERMAEFFRRWLG